VGDLAIGIVTDEISPDLAVALRHGISWGIRLYELRCIGTQRVPHVDARTRSALARARRELDVHFTALSPGCFKCAIDDEAQTLRDSRDTLPRALDLACALGCPTVIVFGFRRDRATESTAAGSAAAERDAAERVAEVLHAAAVSAASRGLTIAVENEPGFFCDSGGRTASILAAAGHPALRANWDPANAFGCGGAPFPDGYEALRPFIANVHAKDTREGSLVRCVPLGEGLLDWRGQLAALRRDGGVGHVTVETHCEPLIDCSRRSVETLREWLGVSARDREQQHDGSA
jgi:sugar phosphate isomerase/epimerase